MGAIVGCDLIAPGNRRNGAKPLFLRLAMCAQGSTPLFASLPFLAPAPASAQSDGATAFETGCSGGCHRCEARVLRVIPRGTDAVRQAWISAFIDRHPCLRDEAGPAILNYLVARSRR